MPRWLDAERVTFKYGLGDELITILRTLHTLGLDGTDPVTVKGVEVSPRDVVAAVLPDPATIGPRMKGKTCAGVFVTGTGKDGQPRSTYLYHVSDNEETMARVRRPVRRVADRGQPRRRARAARDRRLERQRGARAGGLRRGALPRPARSAQAARATARPGAWRTAEPSAGPAATRGGSMRGWTRTWWAVPPSSSRPRPGWCTSARRSSGSRRQPRESCSSQGPGSVETSRATTRGAGSSTDYLEAWTVVGLLLSRSPVALLARQPLALLAAPLALVTGLLPLGGARHLRRPARHGRPRRSGLEEHASACPAGRGLGRCPGGGARWSPAARVAPRQRSRREARPTWPARSWCRCSSSSRSCSPAWPSSRSRPPAGPSLRGSRLCVVGPGLRCPWQGRQLALIGGVVIERLPDLVRTEADGRVRTVTVAIAQFTNGQSPEPQSVDLWRSSPSWARSLWRWPLWPPCSCAPLTPWWWVRGCFALALLPVGPVVRPVLALAGFAILGGVALRRRGTPSADPRDRLFLPFSRGLRLDRRRLEPRATAARSPSRPPGSARHGRD